MKKIFVLVIILFISACGYHLRAANSLAKNYPQLQLSINNQSLLKQPLIKALIASDVKLLEQSDNKLHITKDSLRKVIQSIGANNQVQEYRLEYDVEYQLADLNKKTVHLERDYSFDIQQITGGQQEEQTLRKQLSEDMAWAIIRQINASINNK